MNKRKYNFYLEITTACNLKCPFCPSSNVKKHKFMPFEMVIQLIDKIHEYIKILYFHVLGEPTLHPNFIKILDYCEVHKIPFGITTNGVLLYKYENQLLKYQYLQKLNISLQCLINFDEAEQDLYFKHLNEFLEKRSKKEHLIAINLRLWNNKNYLTNLLLTQKVLQIYQPIVKSSININISKADEFTWPSLEHSYNTTLTNCYGGKKQFAILNDGTLCLCCLDYQGKTKIGNLLTNDLPTLLASKTCQEALLGFNNRKPYFELCKKCTYRNRFK